MFDTSDSDSSVSVSSGESVWTESEDEKSDEVSGWMVPPNRQVNEYVAVKYDNKLFPGVIIAVSDTQATVSSMVKSGRLWKWPERQDILNYNWEAVVSRVKEPRKTSTTRNVYAVEELETYYD